jgi:hypothetical protein
VIPRVRGQLQRSSASGLEDSEATTTAPVHATMPGSLVAGMEFSPRGGSSFVLMAAGLACKPSIGTPPPAASWYQGGRCGWPPGSPTGLAANLLSSREPTGAEGFDLLMPSAGVTGGQVHPQRPPRPRPGRLPRCPK